LRESELVAMSIAIMAAIVVVTVVIAMTVAAAMAVVITVAAVSIATFAMTAKFSFAAYAEVRSPAFMLFPCVAKMAEYLVAVSFCFCCTDIKVIVC